MALCYGYGSGFGISRRAIIKKAVDDLKKLNMFVAFVLSCVIIASVCISAVAAEESFKKGLAYLLSGAIVYDDAEGVNALFQVQKDTGVYVIENATNSSGSTIKANDLLKVAISVEGKVQEVYAWSFDVRYMTSRQLKNYDPDKGAGAYGVILGNAEVGEAPTPRPVITRDPDHAIATKEPGRTTARRRATATPRQRAGRNEVTPVPTPRVTPTPEPIFPAFIAVQPVSISGPISAPATLSLIAENVKKYQWQYKRADQDWADLTESDEYKGTAQAELQFTLNDENAAWKYRCLINGVENTLISNEVGITVTTELRIISQPADAVAAAGAEAVFEVKAVNAAKWIWEEETAGEWTDASAYTVTLVDERTSQLKLTATDAMKGKKFRCHLIGVNGDDLYTEPASLITGSAARIIKQPENVSAANGGKAVLHVDAENAITYQWQYDDGISGWWDLVERDDRIGTNTDTLTLVVRPTVAEFKYRCVITGAENTVETKAVMINIK